LIRTPTVAIAVRGLRVEPALATHLRIESSILVTLIRMIGGTIVVRGRGATVIAAASITASASTTAETAVTPLRVTVRVIWLHKTFAK
jgi:hypothetical protein